MSNEQLSSDFCLVSSEFGDRAHKKTLFMQSKPNFPLFWAKNRDSAKKQTQSKPNQTQFSTYQLGGSLKAAGFGDGEPRAQNVLFMQNKPNSKKRQMNLNLYTKRCYATLDTCSHAKNEPKTNPNEPNFRATEST